MQDKCIHNEALFSFISLRHYKTNPFFHPYLTDNLMKKNPSILKLFSYVKNAFKKKDVLLKYY